MLVRFIVFLLRSFRPLGAEEKYAEQNRERRIHCDLMRRLHLSKAKLPDESGHACENYFPGRRPKVVLKIGDIIRRIID
jgi:hypothetical protein